jgi:hypothetical protein
VDSQQWKQRAELALRQGFSGREFEMRIEPKNTIRDVAGIPSESHKSHFTCRAIVHLINRNQNVAISGKNSFCSSIFSIVSFVASLDLPRFYFGLDGIFPTGTPNAKIRDRARKKQNSTVEGVWHKNPAESHSGSPEPKPKHCIRGMNSQKQ